MLRKWQYNNELFTSKSFSVLGDKINNYTVVLQLFSLCDCVVHVSVAVIS